MFSASDQKEYPTPLSLVPFILSAAGAILLTFFKIDSADVWFHLAAGRVFWEFHRIVPQEVLTYSIEGKTWQAFEWLHQVVLYGLYDWGGLWAVAIAKSILVGSLAFLLFSLSQQISGMPWISAFTTLFFIHGCRGWFSARPQLWDYFLIGWFMFSLDRVLKDDDPRWLYWLPIFEVLWVNAHGAISLLGVVLVTIAFLTKPSKNLAITSLLCLAATFLNPWGFHVYTHAWVIMHMPIIRDLTDWFKPKLSDHFFVLRWTIAVISSVAAMRRERFLSLVVLFFALLSLEAYRHMPFLFLSSIPVVSCSLGMVGEFTTRRIGHPWTRVLATLLCGIVVWKIGESLHQDRLQYRFGVGADAIHGTESVAAFILNNHIHGRMFNAMSLGGPLEWDLWPEERVFMDGRPQAEYGETLIRKTAYWFRDKNWQSLNDQYHFEYVVIPTLLRVRCRDIDESPDMALVFWDDEAFVYIRRLPKFAHLIQRYEFKSLKPYDNSYSYVDRQGQDNLAREELLRARKQSPHHFAADSILTLWCNRHGQLDQALDWARDGVITAPWNAYAHDALSRALENKGFLVEALKAEKMACKLDSQPLFTYRLALLTQRLKTP